MFCRRFTDSESFIRKAIDQFGNEVVTFELIDIPGMFKSTRRKAKVRGPAKILIFQPGHTGLHPGRGGDGQRPRP